MGRLDGKIALVTGAASGIGAACAETLAREGALVIATDLQEDAGQALAGRIVAAGGQALFLQHDVTSEDAWVRVIGETERRFSRLDVLVNNAGVAIPRPSITEMSLEDFRRQMAVNVEGVFLGLKHTLPLMRRAGHGGSIINMSSVAGLRGSRVLSAYSASKGAVRLLSKAVAIECAELKDGVRVNSVHPGLIETPIWDSMASPGQNFAPDLDGLAARAVPIGVKGAPQDIAEGVLWLACDESRYVTGAELVIDGGMTAR